MRGFCFRTFLGDAPAIMIAACGVADAQAVTKFDGNPTAGSLTLASGGKQEL